MAWTDWNIEGRLQGRHDIPLNDRGRGQAQQCGEILCDLFARDGRAATDFHYVSEPAGARAPRPWTSCARRSAFRRPAMPAMRALEEIAFGEWEGLTYLEVLKRDRTVVRHSEEQQVAVSSVARRRDL